MVFKGSRRDEIIKGMSTERRNVQEVSPRHTLQCRCREGEEPQQREWRTRKKTREATCPESQAKKGRKDYQLC